MVLGEAEQQFRGGPAEAPHPIAPCGCTLCRNSLQFSSQHASVSGLAGGLVEYGFRRRYQKMSEDTKDYMFQKTPYRMEKCVKRGQR